MLRGRLAKFAGVSMKLGSHMSAAGGAWKAIERARSVDCQSTQIFIKSNMQWFGKPPKPADAERFRTELAKGDVGTVFGHAGYLINLAGPDGDTATSRSSRSRGRSRLPQRSACRSSCCIPARTLAKATTGA